MVRLLVSYCREMGGPEKSGVQHGLDKEFLITTIGNAKRQATCIWFARGLKSRRGRKNSLRIDPWHRKNRWTGDPRNGGRMIAFRVSQ